MRYFLLPLFTLFFLSLNPVSAQVGNPASAGDSTTLRQQYDAMLKVSNRFQKFKVVDQSFLDAFIVNVSDSIKVYTTEIGDLNQTISTQASKIAGLTQDVAERDNNIASLTSEKDNISLLGFPMSKGLYSTIMWATIFGLLALLAFAFVRMNVALSTAKEARINSSLLTDELAKAKKRRLEVEQDLGRKLQDEINKNRSR